MEQNNIHIYNNVRENTKNKDSVRSASSYGKSYLCGTFSL
jgi:hypothetical protein